MKVVLYTGGLDSFIGLWLLRREEPEWVPIYFDTRVRYAWKEKQSFIDNRPEGERVRIIYDMLDFHAVEVLAGDDPHIPQRNTLLCTATQALYDGAVTDIALCSVADDIYRDNGAAFHIAMSHLLTLTAGYDVRVFSPLQKGSITEHGIPHNLLTKQQAVQKYLDLGGDAQALRQTVSCYGSEEKCGTCKACYRHAEALRTIKAV